MMNVEDVEKVFSKQIASVDFWRELKVQACLIGFDNQFIIALREDDSSEEHKIGLIHEVAHIHFDSLNPRYLSTDLGKLSDEEFIEMEEFIEQQARKFCAENLVYLEEVYKRYKLK